LRWITGKITEGETGGIMVYQLLIFLPQTAYIRIGKRGRFKFPRGYYIYTGSARTGLKKRVERHLRKRKRKFWHIDYLLARGRVERVMVHTDEGLSECSVSRNTLRRPGAKIIVPKFGASDCDCPAHLVFFEMPEAAGVDSAPQIKG